MRPAPELRVVYPATPPGLAVLTIAAFQYSTFFQSGCACLTSAAMPVVCGVAIDVPDSITASVPVPIPAEAMLTPGAVTSGFSALSPGRGPNDEKLAIAAKL